MRARKIFNAVATLSAITPTSLLSLMQTSALKWTYETDGTTPSMDSVLGSEAGIVPGQNIWIGSDSNVRDQTGGSFYQGFPVASGSNYSLQDFGGGTGNIDPTQIYLYARNDTPIAIAFQAR